MEAEGEGKKVNGTASNLPESESRLAAELKPVQSTQSKFASMRRSQRVHFSVAITIYGKTPSGELYEEPTCSIIVSANGALVKLAAEVKLNDRLLMINRQTQRESECYVAWVSEMKDGTREVGIGFIEPAPHFWGITFPPADWDSATRKLPTRKTP